MNIVIIGAGKICATLTEQLLREGHEITVVDTRTAALDAIGNTLDVMTVEGNGISMDTQVEAGVPSADLVIAVMSTDEQNLLSCLIAKRLGVGNTIARVRNPEYTSGLHLIQDDLGLSMALNPELASATEIARILRAPASIKIDTFSKGRVELHKMRIDPGSILDGMKLSDLGRLQSGALVCVVERGQHEVYIPEWGVTLTTAQSVGDDVKAIGIRAHYFNPTAPTNRFAVEYIEEMEEPFEWIIEFRPRTAAADAQGVWWRLSKDKRPQSFPAELGIAPANILLLY